MNIKPIKSEEDYEFALKRIEEIWSAPDNTPESDELEILITLVEKYESIHYPLFENDVDPISIIKYTLEEKGLKQKDLIPLMGSKSNVSNVLNKRRSLTLEMVKSLHAHLGIPLQLLVA